MRRQGARTHHPVEVRRPTREEDDASRIAAQASSARQADHLNVQNLLSLQRTAGNGAAVSAVQRFSWPWEDEAASDAPAQDGQSTPDHQDGSVGGQSEGYTQGGMALSQPAPAGYAAPAIWFAPHARGSYSTTTPIPPFAGAAKEYPLFSQVAFVLHAPNDHSTPMVRSTSVVIPGPGPIPGAGAAGPAQGGAAGGAAGGQAGQQTTHGGGAGGAGAGNAGQVSGGAGGGGGGGAAVALPASRQISAGFQGQDVQALQVSLNEKIHAALGADGMFGAMTAQALRSFQAQASLVADGIAGRRTWEALGFTPTF